MSNQPETVEIYALFVGEYETIGHFVSIPPLKKKPLLEPSDCDAELWEMKAQEEMMPFLLRSPMSGLPKDFLKESDPNAIFHLVVEKNPYIRLNRDKPKIFSCTDTGERFCWKFSGRGAAVEIGPTQGLDVASEFLKMAKEDPWQFCELSLSALVERTGKNRGPLSAFTATYEDNGALVFAYDLDHAKRVLRFHRGECPFPGDLLHEELFEEGCPDFGWKHVPQYAPLCRYKWGYVETNRSVLEKAGFVFADEHECDCCYRVTNDPENEDDGHTYCEQMGDWICPNERLRHLIGGPPPFANRTTGLPVPPVITDEQRDQANLFLTAFNKFTCSLQKFATEEDPSKADNANFLGAKMGIPCVGGGFYLLPIAETFKSEVQEHGGWKDTVWSMDFFVKEQFVAVRVKIRAFLNAFNAFTGSDIPLFDSTEVLYESIMSDDFGETESYALKNPTMETFLSLIIHHLRQRNLNQSLKIEKAGL